jgi:hypothetical protein
MVKQNYFEKNLGSEMNPLEQHLSNNRQRFSEQQMHRQLVSGHYAVQAETKTEVPLWGEDSIPGTESGTDTASEVNNTSFSCNVCLALTS